MSNEAIERRLEALVKPAVFEQMAYYRQLGLRSRLLTLLWRQVPSVSELTRLLAREDLLWARAVQVRQQSLSERFLVFPAELFERVYKAIYPRLCERWEVRQQRPLPASLQGAHNHFAHIWVADGSALEALFRKLKALEEVPTGQLAGKMAVVIDLLRQKIPKLDLSPFPI